MAWIVGRKADHSIVEVLNKKPEWSKAELKEVIPINYGGVQGDYSYYKLSEQELNRYDDRDDYTLTWVDDDITALDFGVEDNKRRIRFTSDKKKIKGDGVEAIVVTAEVWNAANTAIDTTYNGTMIIDIDSGRRDGLAELVFTSGVATKTLKTTECGKWRIPLNRKHVEDNDNESFKVDKDYTLKLKIITF